MCLKLDPTPFNVYGMRKYPILKTNLQKGRMSTPFVIVYLFFIDHLYVQNNHKIEMEYFDAQD